MKEKIIIFGTLFSIIGTILIWKYNSKGLIGFGTFNGPWVDKRRLWLARLGLVLLILGIAMQFIGGILMRC